LHIPPEQTALQLTENILVGTYVMQVAPDGSPRFTFLSQRWLDMLDLECEALMADPFNRFKCVHPDDYEALIALNLEVFAPRLILHCVALPKSMSTACFPRNWQDSIVSRSATVTTATTGPAKPSTTPSI
jgi:hypothetical protein